jgi:uroporphyrinogen-III decarboxylase
MDRPLSSRERLLAALRGQPVDRLPWSPFLAYWWESQSPELQSKGQPWFFKEIGADALLRGFAMPFTASFASERCQVEETAQGDTQTTRYLTPVGALATVSRYSAQGNTRFVVDHPVHTTEDFKTLTYLVEHMTIEPNHGPIQAAIDTLGDDGLFVPLVSPFGKTPFQSLVEHWVGTQQLVYSLADHPDTVETCLATMSERALEAVRLSVDSPAEAFISWEDTSTTNVSPAMFDRYIVPDINLWGGLIHAAGKLFLHHACGHVRALIGSLASEAIDAVESLTPPPTGNIEIWEAQAALGPRVGVIGGIEPTRLLFLDLPELAAYVEELLARVDPRGYVLANSDSCPPGVAIEKFKLITQLARARRL